MFGRRRREPARERTPDDIESIAELISEKRELRIERSELRSERSELESVRSNDDVSVRNERRMKRFEETESEASKRGTLTSLSSGSTASPPSTTTSR